MNQSSHAETKGQKNTEPVPTPETPEDLQAATMARLEQIRHVQTSIQALTEEAKTQHFPLWQQRLKAAKQAASLSNEQLKAEGRHHALECYDSSEAAYYYPEPPSISLLIQSAVRNSAEEAFMKRMDLLVKTIFQIKPDIMARLLNAKKNLPANIEIVRELGKSLNLVSSLMNDVSKLDKAVRSRLNVSTKRLDKYRNSCQVRDLPSIDYHDIHHSSPDMVGITATGRSERVSKYTGADVKDIPTSPSHPKDRGKGLLRRPEHLVLSPSLKGYKQILDFYRLTDVTK